MARDEERLARAQEEPIVLGLPDVPGILAAIHLTPRLGVHLRGLADELLVHDFPGATIARHEREMLAVAVSAQNDCFFCMDSHAAHAAAVMERFGITEIAQAPDALIQGDDGGLGPKMRALLRIARQVGSAPRELTVGDVDDAKAAGATDADVQLAVLIAAGFSMYNRLVDGFRARTPADPEAYRERAAQIAEFGYTPPAGPPRS